MYEHFYGLQGRPFQLTPDPHYYFESATHRKALSYLGYGLAQGEGFIVITGDIGAGKTTLVGHLMHTIDPVRLTAVKIVSTQVGGDDMLRLAAQSFGLATDGMTKAATLQQIEGFLHGQARAGRRTLLIVDEAQNLGISAIEELRMLSNFQLGGQSLLQIFLLGQPEFRDLLKSPELEQLRQRVIATHHLEPMLPREVEPYVLHRLGVAGWSGNPAFSPAAFSALYAATGGVPRRLNALLSRVLLMGAIEEMYAIDADTVAAVVADMGLDTDVAPAPLDASPLDTMTDAPVEDHVEAIEADTIEAQAPEAEAVEVEPEAEAEAEAVEAESDPVDADELALDDSLRAPEEAPITLEPPVMTDVEADVAEAPEATPPPAFLDTAAFEPEDEPIAEPAFSPFARRLGIVAPFARPAAFAPPVEAEVEVEPETDDYWAELRDEPADATPEDEPVAIADAPADPEDMAQDEPTAPEPSAVADTPADADLTALRRDMQDEIAALRAEIASLRAVQAHVPFAPAQTIDPEALKSCFTLIEERLSSLEFRAEEQDAALRRVLTLLIEWVEREDRMEGTVPEAAVA